MSMLQRSERVAESKPSESLRHGVEAPAGAACERASGSGKVHTSEK